MADQACTKVRSGIGEGFACRTHGRPWPCAVREQPAEQLAILHRASPLAPAVIAELAAERLHQVEMFGLAADVEKPAVEWLGLLAEYLERASVEATDLASAAMMGEPLHPDGWRRRLLQVAAIAAAGVEAVDRMTTGD